jgi:hypothetical protein
MIETFLMNMPIGNWAIMASFVAQKLCIAWKERYSPEFAEGLWRVQIHRYSCSVDARMLARVKKIEALINRELPNANKRIPRFETETMGRRSRLHFP